MKCPRALAFAFALPQIEFLEARRLWGLGLGWIDARLLASSLVSGCGHWTLDKRLGQVVSTLDSPG